MTRTSLGLPKRVAWSAALILLLGLLAFKAGKEGLSNFYVQSAHLEIQRWAKPGQAYRAEDWTRVMHYLASSLRYSPGNPWALEESGTLQLRSMSAARGSAARRSSRAQRQCGLSHGAGAAADIAFQLGELRADQTLSGRAGR